MPTNRIHYLAAVGLMVALWLAATSVSASAPTTGSGLAAESAQEGSKIAFSRGRAIFVMNADGSTLRKLTRNVPSDGGPVWSPDGRKITFRSARDGNGEIYVMNADGSRPRRLTRNPASDGGPVWSPDGRKIAFVRFRAGNSDVYVMTADGSGQRNLTPNPEGRRPTRDRSPAWSPDGRSIAFASNRDGNYGIYVMNADGSGLRRLTRNLRAGGGPVWSPDGRKIAFGSDRDSNGEIYVMNADGSDQRNLTRSPAGDGDPAWSPDGRRIVFVRSFASGRRGYADVYVMNADGSGQRRLARGKRSGVFPPTGQWFSLTPVSPRWSPDGRRIAFVSNRHRNFEIYVIKADGSGQRNLTRKPGADVSPAWSPGRDSGSVRRGGANVVEPLAQGRVTRTVEGVRFSLEVPRTGWATGPIERIGRTRSRPPFRTHSLLISKSLIGGQAAEAVIFWTGFRDRTEAAPCAKLLGPAIGRSIADVAKTVAGAQGTKLVRGPTRVTVGGRPAQHVVLRVLSARGCDPGYFFTWRTQCWGPCWIRMDATDTIRVWIVKVGGTRLCIEAATKERHAVTREPVASAELSKVEREITKIVASIRFD
jgi:Tol biopolymer transport system component